MADGQVKIDVVIRSLSELKNIQKELGSSLGRVKLLNTGVGSLGNKLGFVAFQFTFMAGIAGRALQEIRQGIQQTVEEGAKAQDTVIRAISQSGLDITGSTQGAAKSIKFLNDVIRDFGTGKTIFNTNEVAEASKEIGRAFNFVGTQEQIAVQGALVLKGALRLMTIEGLGAEKAAINLSKTMKTFGKSVAEVNEVVNTLVVVNQQSSITLDGLVRSLAFAGSFATEFGATMEETAVILGVIQDRLGRTEGGPGQNLRVLFENLSRVAVSTNQQLRQFGVEIRNDEGKLNNIIDIIRQFKTALDNAGEQGDLARQFIAELGTRSVRARTALLNLVQGIDDVEAGLENLGDLGVAERLEAIFSQTTEGRIKSLKAAIGGLKIDFQSGLAPALTLMTIEIRELVKEGSGFAELIKSIGSTLGNDLVPALRFIVKAIKALSNTFKKNELLVSVLTKSMVALLGVLTALFIVGTLGSLVAIVAAGLGRLAGVMGITQVAAIGLARAFLPVFIAGLGIFLSLKAIDNIMGVFKDGLEDGEEGALAFNVALLGLGATITALSFGGAIKAISGALLGLFPTKAAVAAAATAYTGSTVSTFPGINALWKNQGTTSGNRFSNAFSAITKKMPPRLTSLVARLGTAGPFAAAIVAGAIIGTAIGFTVKKAIQEAEDMGMNDAGELMMFSLGAALSNMIDAISAFRADAIINYTAMQEKFGEFILQVIDPSTWDLAAANFEENFAKPVIAGLRTIGAGMKDFGLLITDTKAFDISSGSRAVTDLLRELDNAGEFDLFKSISPTQDLSGFGAERLLIQLQNDPLFQKIITELGPEHFNADEQKAAIEAYINSTIRQNAVIDQLTEKMIGIIQPTEDVAIMNTDYRDMMLQALEGVNARVISDEGVVDIQDEFNETLEDNLDSVSGLAGATDGVTDALILDKTGVDTHTTATDADSTALGKETGSLGKNTKELIANSKKVSLDSIAVDRETLEISNNMNALLVFTVEVDRAAIGFSLLARESAEVARRLASVTMDSDGTFHMDGRTTAGVSASEVSQLGSGFDAANQRLADDLVREKIDLSQLQTQQKLLDATNTFSNDTNTNLEEINEGVAAIVGPGGSGGGSDVGFTDINDLALNQLEQDRIDAFEHILESLNPSDGDLLALIDSFNRSGTTRSLRDILGESLEAFVEAILLRDVNLTPQANSSSLSALSLNSSNASSAEAMTRGFGSLIGSITPIDPGHDIFDDPRLRGRDDGRNKFGDDLFGIGDKNKLCITNNIEIKVDGLADNFTADEVALRVVDTINNSIQGRNTLRR